MIESQVATEKIFTYSLYKKFFAIFTYMLIMSFGFFCVYLGIWLTIIIGLLLIAATFVNIVNVILFKKLIIDDEFLKKEWYFFGDKKIALNDLMAFNSDKIWKNSISFLSRNGGRKLNFCMNLECYLLKRSNYEEVKNLLIDKKIITGEERCWNTKKRVSLLRKMFKNSRK